MSYQKWPKAEKLSWDGVSTERRGGALPRWLYFGEIAEAKRGLTGESAKTPGAAKVSITINLGGSYEDVVDVGNRKAFNHFTFGEKALWKCKQLCEALGCDPPNSTGEEDLDEFSETILGETVWFILKVGKNQNGEPDNEIEAFISEAELEEVAASMEAPSGGGDEKAATKSKGRSNGAKANGRGAKAAEMDTDEDADDGDTDDDSDDEAEEAPPAEARRRGRPPKDRSARR